MRPRVEVVVELAEVLVVVPVAVALQDVAEDADSLVDVEVLLAEVEDAAVPCSAVVPQVEEVVQVDSVEVAEADV
eukprot:gene29540-36605_t